MSPRLFSNRALGMGEPPSPSEQTPLGPHVSPSPCVHKAHASDGSGELGWAGIWREVGSLTWRQHRAWPGKLITEPPAPHAPSWAASRQSHREKREQRRLGTDSPRDAPASLPQTWVCVMSATGETEGPK